MGTNKAFLVLNGKPLIEHTKSILDSVCKKVFILGSRELYGRFGQCYEDIYPDCGPLSGIHAALTNVQTKWGLITGVDTPFITAELLSYLVQKAVHSPALVTTPRVAGKVQPLCTVFSRRFLPIAEAALKAGKYKVAALFAEDQSLILDESELGQVALGEDMFENLNTPEDFERARRRATGRSS